MDAALRRNADFASKPCVLQHFGSPPFNSITSKYCKGYKFHKKEDFKMLKNRGVVPGPVTLFVNVGKHTMAMNPMGDEQTHMAYLLIAHPFNPGKSQKSKPLFPGVKMPGFHELQTVSPPELEDQYVVK